MYRVDVVCHTGNGEKLSNSQPCPAVPGCCLVYFHFLCEIHSVQSGPSGRGTQFVDIELKVPTQYKPLTKVQLLFQ